MNDDASLLDEFVEEAHEHLQSVDVDLLHLERHGHDAEVVDRLFRSVHSIKGVSGFLDLSVIGRLSHAIENIFSAIRSDDLAIAQPVLDVLLEATKRLEELIDDAAHSNQADIADLVGRLEGILIEHLPEATAARLTQSVAIDAKAGETISFTVNAYTYDHLSHPYLYRLTFNPDQLNRKPQGAMGIFRELVQVGNILDGKTEVGGAVDLRQGLPEPARVHLLFATDLVQEMLVGFLDLPDDQIHLLRDDDEQRHQALEPSGTVTPGADRERKAVEEMPMETDRCERQAATAEVDDDDLPEAMPATAAAATPDEPAAQAEASKRDLRRSSIKVDGQRLDHLLDLIGELVIAETMVCQSPQVTSARDPILAKRVSQLDKITRELQEMGTGLRMVPVRSCFQRMSRLVRDIARKLDKPVELHVSGEETELDKNVVERIADPLVHMLRNAIDHGLEDQRDRTAAGKPAVGQVHLRAFHKGGYIYIEVEDDGRGLDQERILAKAVKLGLVAPGAQLDEKDIYALVFKPGFSTATAVTDVSGRGVGMDVVKRNISDLRGIVDITSTPGHGSCFSIRLPLTMAIIDGMTVRVGEERFVIPTASIVMTAAPKPQQISRTMGRGELWRFQETHIPLYRLDHLFGFRAADERPCPHQVVVIEEDGRQAALAIDELCSQQQVVIKPLGSLLQGLPGITGGAVMPDGRVGLILEIGGILRVAEDCARSGRSQPLIQQGASLMNPHSDGSALPGSTANAEAGKYLAFELGGEYYGIRILSAQEIIGLMDITAVPWTPAFIRGVINLRGKVIPIVDLRRRFGLDADQERERCIMVVQVESGTDTLVMGIIIDQVPDVHQIEQDAIEDPPPFCSGIDATFVLGVAKVHERVLMLLDGDRLLSPEECDLLKHHTRQHQA